MTFTEVFTLLQLAISLLIAASGPNVPPALEEQAKSVANYAITVANQSLAKDPTLGGTKPSDAPPVPNVQVPNDEGDAVAGANPSPSPSPSPSPANSLPQENIEINVVHSSEDDSSGLPGRKILHLAVMGNWDKSFTRLWNNSGDLLIGDGNNKQYCEYNIGTECGENAGRGGRMGHFYDLNNIPLGTYQWKIEAQKGNSSATKEGEIVLE